MEDYFTYSYYSYKAIRAKDNKEYVSAYLFRFAIL